MGRFTKKRLDRLVRKYPMVLVRWHDAVVRPGWNDQLDGQVAGAVTLGFLLKRTRSKIVLGHSLGTEHKVGDKTIIPMGMVRSIEHVRTDGG